MEAPRGQVWHLNKPGGSNSWVLALPPRVESPAPTHAILCPPHGPLSSGLEAPVGQRASADCEWGWAFLPAALNKHI